eukprot:1159911-Pelagomonas_calceolata.AAC.19
MSCVEGCGTAPPLGMSSMRSCGGPANPLRKSNVRSWQWRTCICIGNKQCEVLAVAELHLHWEQAK